ncbi:ASCH domain-containing protein [Pseudomonas putida]|uniref:ASCH domain-containing protein n=1 Tax=Pseudomonas putida TaxID=303 RepID=UPI000CD433D8|nr:ASCH domain-containing protein [Pseudomonas putida]
MKVLLSIKPEYATKILSGEKKFEFRKVGFNEPGVNTVIIYATKPIGKLVGEFEVVQVLTGSPSKIWEYTKENAGIDKRFFDLYYKGKKQAVAIAVGEVTRYTIPKQLSELGIGNIPPQSFRYIKTCAPRTFDQAELELT